MYQPGLLEQIHASIQHAVASVSGLSPAEVDPQLRFADGRFGDLQANFAMALARKLERKPRDLALDVVNALPPAATALLAEPPTVAGPGFVNLRLADAALAAELARILADPNLGITPADAPRHVVVDYCGANIAKQMHVGHLRSLILGDAIARVLEFLGHRVTRQNHVGDWGLQMGMITHAVRSAQIPPEKLDLATLERLYREVNRQQDADPDLRRQLIANTRELQQADKAGLVHWQAARRLTLDAVHSVFQQLGVSLGPEHVRGESDYAERYAPMIQDLLQRKIARPTEGAIGIFPDGFSNKDGEPRPFIVQSRDGTYQYATFDLAAIAYRAETLQADRVVYTHDARQAEHFAMLFAAARQAGYAGAMQLDFAPFGTVLGEDRKPLKTRSGENVLLADLLREAVDRAQAMVREKNPDLPETQSEQIARAVGIGALKYADLSNERIRDYEFNWDRMLALKGNTAPYLQYAYTRICSILTRAGHPLPDQPGSPPTPATPLAIAHPAERAAVLGLMQFPSAVRHVADKLEPHVLCNQLYDIATRLHALLEQCVVLCDEPDQRAARLALCTAVARTLSTGLHLLGIQTPTRM